ncbi:hypothetical protein GGS20DRAFT_597008 [Poronia punctata]|nr:hypothetical protein GGS20DRAFT_597008 [Poronia punctata]
MAPKYELYGGFSISHALDEAGPPSQGIFHQGEPPIEFFDKVPENSPAVFSTVNGTKPFRLVDNPTYERSGHHWWAAEIQLVCDELRRNLPDTCKTIEAPKDYWDLYKYFDCYDIYYRGAQNLWNVINTLLFENQYVQSIVDKEQMELLAENNFPWFEDVAFDLLKNPVLQTKLMAWNKTKEPDVLKAFSPYDLQVFDCYEDYHVCFLDVMREIFERHYECIQKGRPLLNHATPKGAAERAALRAKYLDPCFDPFMDKFKIPNKIINGIVIADGTSKLPPPHVHATNEVNTKPLGAKAAAGADVRCRKETIQEEARDKGTVERYSSAPSNGGDPNKIVGDSSTRQEPRIYDGVLHNVGEKVRGCVKPDEPQLPTEDVPSQPIPSQATEVQVPDTVAVSDVPSFKKNSHRAPPVITQVPPMVNAHPPLHHANHSRQLSGRQFWARRPSAHAVNRQDDMAQIPFADQVPAYALSQNQPPSMMQQPNHVPPVFGRPGEQGYYVHVKAPHHGQSGVSRSPAMGQGHTGQQTTTNPNTYYASNGRWQQIGSDDIHGPKVIFRKGSVHSQHVIHQRHASVASNGNNGRFGNIQRHGSHSYGHNNNHVNNFRFPNPTQTLPRTTCVNAGKVADVHTQFDPCQCRRCSERDRTVFVRGLPDGAALSVEANERLAQYFNQYGEIELVFSSQRSSTCAFVKYYHISSALAAVSAAQRVTIAGLGDSINAQYRVGSQFYKVHRPQKYQHQPSGSITTPPQPFQREQWSRPNGGNRFTPIKTVGFPVRSPTTVRSQAYERAPQSSGSLAEQRTPKFTNQSTLPRSFVPSSQSAYPPGPSPPAHFPPRIVPGSPTPASKRSMKQDDDDTIDYGTVVVRPGKAKYTAIPIQWRQESTSQKPRSENSPQASPQATKDDGSLSPKAETSQQEPQTNDDDPFGPETKPIQQEHTIKTEVDNAASQKHQEAQQEQASEPAHNDLLKKQQDQDKQAPDAAHDDLLRKQSQEDKPPTDQGAPDEPQDNNAHAKRKANETDKDPETFGQTWPKKKLAKAIESNDVEESQHASEKEAKGLGHSTLPIKKNNKKNKKKNRRGAAFPLPATEGASSIVAPPRTTTFQPAIEEPELPSYPQQPPQVAEVAEEEQKQATAPTSPEPKPKTTEVSRLSASPVSQKLLKKEPFPPYRDLMSGQNPVQYLEGTIVSIGEYKSSTSDSSTTTSRKGDMKLNPSAQDFVPPPMVTTPVRPIPIPPYHSYSLPGRLHNNRPRATINAQFPFYGQNFQHQAPVLAQVYNPTVMQMACVTASSNAPLGTSQPMYGPPLPAHNPENSGTQPHNRNPVPPTEADQGVGSWRQDGSQPYNNNPVGQSGGSWRHGGRKGNFKGRKARKEEWKRARQERDWRGDRANDGKEDIKEIDQHDKSKGKQKEVVSKAADTTTNNSEKGKGRDTPNNTEKPPSLNPGGVDTTGNSKGKRKEDISSSKKAADTTNNSKKGKGRDTPDVERDPRVDPGAADKTANDSKRGKGRATPDIQKNPSLDSGAMDTTNNSKKGKERDIPDVEKNQSLPGAVEKTTNNSKKGKGRDTPDNAEKTPNLDPGVVDTTTKNNKKGKGQDTPNTDKSTSLPGVSDSTNKNENASSSSGVKKSRGGRNRNKATKLQRDEGKNKEKELAKSVEEMVSIPTPTASTSTSTAPTSTSTTDKPSSPPKKSRLPTLPAIAEQEVAKPKAKPTLAPIPLFNMARNMRVASAPAVSKEEEKGKISEHAEMPPPDGERKGG